MPQQDQEEQTSNCVLKIKKRSSTFLSPEETIENTIVAPLNKSAKSF